MHLCHGIFLLCTGRLTRSFLAAMHTIVKSQLTQCRNALLSSTRCCHAVADISMPVVDQRRKKSWYVCGYILHTRES
jgi:hypothetical protein